MTGNNDLQALLDDYFEYLVVEKSLSPLTIKDYRHYLSRFFTWLSDNSLSLTPQAITMDSVRKFRIYLSTLRNNRDLPLKKDTQIYHIVSIRSFLRYLISKRDINVLNPDKIDLPKSDPRMISYLSAEQLKRLLESPEISDEPGLRDRAILETLFSTGLRVSELVKLNRDQVNLERKEFGVKGKGNKIRLVFLSNEAAGWISRYLSARQDTFQPLFIRYSGPTVSEKNSDKMRLTARSIEMILKKYSRKCGLPFDAHPHTLRHSFATDLLIAGADLRSVQEMLGHESIRTTQIYTHVTNRHLKEVHQKYHGKT
jgi:site-specific recombinase XerD